MQQALNRAFLLIQDFEYTVYPDDSTWTLLTSKELPETPLTATRLPLPDISGTNDFAAMSFVEINTFVRAHETGLKDVDISSYDWLIIDQTGLDTSTCLVCERYYNYGEEGGEEGMTDEFRACRIPYEEAWITITNLDVGNMGFEEFVDEDAGMQEDGSWKWRVATPDTHANEKSGSDIKRDEALRELRDSGHAD